MASGTTARKSGPVSSGSGSGQRSKGITAARSNNGEQTSSLNLQSSQWASQEATGGANSTATSARGTSKKKTTKTRGTSRGSDAMDTSKDKPGGVDQPGGIAIEADTEAIAESLRQPVHAPKKTQSEPGTRRTRSVASTASSAPRRSTRRTERVLRASQQEDMADNRLTKRIRVGEAQGGEESQDELSLDRLDPDIFGGPETSLLSEPPISDYRPSSILSEKNKPSNASQGSVVRKARQPGKENLEPSTPIFSKTSYMKASRSLPAKGPLPNKRKRDEEEEQDQLSMKISTKFNCRKL